MKLNTHPDDRKTMVHAISGQLGVSAEYLRMPTYAFRIGTVTVNRDGTTESENSELLEQIRPMLIENGWLDDDPAEETVNESAERSDAETATEIPAPISESEEIENVMLHIPLTDMTELNLKNLLRILYTKQKLFNRMLQLENGVRIAPEALERIDSADADMEGVFAELSGAGFINGFSIGNGEFILFMSYDAGNPAQWEDAGSLLKAIIKLAGEAIRVRVELLELDDHEKYLANVWLNRLGFGGPDNKELRRRLMHHLNGYAAFRNDERMLAHREKLNEKRHADRSNNEEVREDE